LVKLSVVIVFETGSACDSIGSDVYSEEQPSWNSFSLLKEVTQERPAYPEITTEC
jgi:hypothetical protein